MNSDEAAIFSALGNETRLTAFLLLSKSPDGLPATAISDAVGTPQNTMSSHLKILLNAGLVTAHREGRSIRYRAQGDALARCLALLSGSEEI